MNTNAQNEKHPNLDGPLDSAVWAVLSDPISQDAVDRVKRRAQDAISHQISSVDAGPWGARRKIVRVVLPLVAVAASALWVLSTLAVPTTAFAQVIDQISQIKTATFSIESTGDKYAPQFVAKATVKSPDRLRFDFTSPSQTVNVTNYADGELISYDANHDQVTVHEIHHSKAGFDILRQLRDVHANAVLDNRENTMAGTDLYKIFAERGRVWVDQKTQLPHRIEVTTPEESGAARVVYSDFRWNVPVDDSLFAIPAGRTVVRDSLLAEPTESELVAAFRIRHAFSQEPYQPSFWGDQVGLRLGRMAYDLSKDRTENDVRQQSKLRDCFGQIGISAIESQDPASVQKRIDFLCMKLDQWEHQISRSGGWVGDGVLPGDPKALCWWSDGGQIRVLRADLVIIDAERPPAAK